MSTRASGTFDIDAWEDGKKPFDEAGETRLNRIHVGKTFHGDLVGTSSTELLTVATQAGPVSYVGVELVRGILHGREGTFVLRHQAQSTDEDSWLTWVIVPTSGTGELAGIRGEGSIDIGPDGTHSYTLDYELAGD